MDTENRGGKGRSLTPGKEERKITAQAYRGGENQGGRTYLVGIPPQVEEGRRVVAGQEIRT